jgi:protein-L-isoaspartate(D-aspartate) O-methyltransferase
VLGKTSAPTVLVLMALTVSLMVAPQTSDETNDGSDAKEAAANDEHRAEMIREIEADVRATRHQTGRSTLNERVLAAVAAVPRHEFVPETHRDRAYENRPLPIGHQQTISQPYIVALMTDLLDLDEGAVVLDVGTGSGYQAAVLAELAERVYSIEIVPELGQTARQRLERLGYNNVEVKIGDGYYGWEEKAPFDAVVLAAAAGEIPQALIDQLKVGARLVLPVGPVGGVQELLVVEKEAGGKLRQRSILPVRFVPLTGEH